MNIAHYLLTGLNSESKLVQLSIAIDADDTIFDKPLQCPTVEPQQTFWKNYVTGVELLMVTNIKPIHGHVAAKGVNRRGMATG